MKTGSWPAFSSARLAAGATTAALVAGPLSAGTASGSMAVTAVVEESCGVDARPMLFGTVPGAHDRVDARSSVVLACTPEASYVVTLDRGRHGDNSTRRMADASGAHFIAYEIYSDAARILPWGATPASAVAAVAPASGLIELPVYARLSAKHARAGAYSDMVTVTVVF